MTKRGDQLSFYDHLDEFRSRLIKTALCILLCSMAAYHYRDPILSLLIKPVERLYFNDPSDAFTIQIGLSLFVGCLIASPFVLYQIWKFVIVALKEEEKRFIYTFGPVSLILFITGTLFAYYIAVPFSISFLLSFSNDMLVPLISVKSYVSFVMTLIMGFGVMFEFPLVILFLAKIGIATPHFLVQKRRHAIVLIFIISAVVTPPDVMSQFVMAIPLMVLYELSIFAARLVAKPNLAYER